MATTIRGRIYRILSDSHQEVPPYYGSTIRELKERWWEHKSLTNDTSSKQLMLFEDARIELVEEVICDSVEELHSREKWWICNNPCCNVKTPMRTEEELKSSQNAYHEAHKEEAKAYKKAYYEDHKDEIKASQKAYYEANKEEAKAYNASHKKERNAKQRERRAKKKLI